MNKIHIPYLLLLSILMALAACGTKPTKTPAPVSDYQEPHRPQFHFSPSAQWMNDPNGMVFYEGEYHLFYQYYPGANVWGPMHWAHAVSTDLVHWQHLPIALFPDSLGYIFSGSAVIDWKNTSGFGKNGQPPMVAIFTYHNMDREKANRKDVETQAIAYSNDRGRTWTKYSKNPVINNPEKDRDFRDPKVIWDEGSQQWVMVLAVGDHAEFWGSPNLKDWTFLSDFGHQFGSHGGVWECPDLFPITLEGSTEQKWVLLMNINPGHPNGGSGTQYFVGEFDGKAFNVDESFANTVPKGTGQWFDYGKDNYAGVTWADVPKSDGRRLLIGWMSNWEYALKVPTVAWRSANTLPRSLHLHKTPGGYRLHTKPVAELRQLRTKTVPLPGVDITGAFDLDSKAGFSFSTAELELEFDVDKSTAARWGIELRNNKGETYQIGFEKKQNRFFSDRTNAGNAAFSETFADKIHYAPRMVNDKTVRLHVFLDHASAEMFADDGAVSMTEIFFPTEPFTSARIFGEGGNVRLSKGTVSQLKRIWVLEK